MRLYHYTFAKHLEAIQKEGLRPSIYSQSDYPGRENGHYLSDLPPHIAKKFTRAEVYKAMFSQTGKWDDYLQNIAFIEFELEDAIVKRVHDLFASRVREAYPELGIWLHSSEENLSSAFISQTGLIRFQAMPSGNQ